MIGLHLAAACEESRLSDSPLWGCAGDCRVEMVVKVHYGTVFGGQMCRHVVNASPKTVPQCTWQPCRPGLARNLKVANRTGLVVFAIWDLLKYFKFPNKFAWTESPFSLHMTRSNLYIKPRSKQVQHLQRLFTARSPQVWPLLIYSHSFVQIFGSCLLFLVCRYTAFLFSTRAVTTLGWLPNAHRDMII